MKVYVVESMGEHSHYGCYGVFSSAEKAEEFIAAECKSDPDLVAELLWINVVDLDNIETPKEYDLEARLLEYDHRKGGY